MSIFGTIAGGLVSGLLGAKGSKDAAKAQAKAAEPYSVHGPLTNIDYNKKDRSFDLQLDPRLEGILGEQLGFAQTEPFFRNQYMNFVNDRYGLGMFDSLPEGRLPLMDQALQQYASGVPTLREPAPFQPLDNNPSDNDMSWLFDNQNGLFSMKYNPMVEQNLYNYLQPWSFNNGN